MKPRILICDDKAEWVKGVSELLGTDKYNLVPAYTVQNSIRKLAQDQKKTGWRARFAVVIVDLAFGEDKNTEGSDDDAGFRILEAAKGDPLLESIVCTGIGTGPRASRAISEGAFGFVQKNAGGDDLLNTVERAIAVRERCLNLIDEFERLAEANPADPGIGSLTTHFIDYIRMVRGRGR